MGITIRLSAIAAFSLLAFGAEAQQMSAVTQLGWLRNGEYAPIMMAEAKGFFKEEGIDHKIVDGGPGKNPIPIVAVGQAQFGLATNGMALITARLAKDPVDVVAVGTLFQQAPTAYLTITAPGAPKPKPKDMDRKVLGTQAGTEFVFKAFAKVNGIDESKVKVVTAQATVEPLMVGKMDYFLGRHRSAAEAHEGEGALDRPHHPLRRARRPRSGDVRPRAHVGSRRRDRR